MSDHSAARWRAVMKRHSRTVVVSGVLVGSLGGSLALASQRAVPDAGGRHAAMGASLDSYEMTPLWDIYEYQH